MMMLNKKFKKYICISVGIVGTSFVGLKALAKYKKGSYIYQNSLKEQNPFEGKKVIFVNDENVKENADGVSGYLEEIGDSDFVPSFYDKYIKRTMDVVLSFGGLVVLSPVFAGVALAIMIEDPGPVFFTQKRVGQNKKYFTLHKFRSMKLSTPHDVPTHQLENPEQYITKIGKFIRAHSLDELPQIWDIFVGNMSVIGPRPALWNQDLLIAERDKYNANDVKPGLTGWAQINGRDELEIEEKARLDGEYVQKESLLFDTKCFIGTISKVGHDDSVVEGGTREMSEKKKWDFTTGKSKEELIGNIGFGGLYTVYIPEDYEVHEWDNAKEQAEFLKEMEDTERYKILLSHIPNTWMYYDTAATFDLDLIFTGHAHGGQAILPFVGGLYAPDMGYFPGRLSGVYEKGHTQVILSRGLGSNTEVIPRFNNIPEIVEVELK